MPESIKGYRDQQRSVPPSLSSLFVSLSHFGESSSPWLVTTASPLRMPQMTAANAFARFGKFLAKWVLTTIPTMVRKCESQRIYWRFEWWAWVDLNHRPRPYQGLLWCYMHSGVAMFTLPTTLLMVASWHDCGSRLPVPSRMEITSHKPTSRYRSAAHNLDSFPIADNLGVT